jgi:hypothetical protein
MVIDGENQSIIACVDATGVGVYDMVTIHPRICMFRQAKALYGGGVLTLDG